MGIKPNSTISFGAGGVDLPSVSGLVTLNLIAEYRFDEGTGQQLTDYVGGYHGQLGSTSGADANDPTWVASPAALEFDGSNDWISLAAAATACGQTCTYMFVVQVDSAGGAQRIIQTDADIVALSFDSSMNLDILRASAVILDGPAPVSNGSRAISVRVDAVTNIDVQVSDGSTMAAYSSGVAAAASGTGAICRLGGASIAFDEKIYYVLMYNRWLTDAEVQQNYQYLKTQMTARSVTI